MVRDAKTFKYYAGHRAPCEHVIRVPGNAHAYEVGVVKRPDGNGFMLAFDPFQRGHGMMDKIAASNPATPGKLMQEYTRLTAIKTMRKSGHRCVERIDANGSKVLKFIKVGA